MATIMKWKIDPTICMISPKIKALASTVEILWPYLYFLVMAIIVQHGNHDQMNYISKIWDIRNDNYPYQWTWPLWSASDIVNIFFAPTPKNPCSTMLITINVSDSWSMHMCAHRSTWTKRSVHKVWGLSRI